MFDLTLTFDNGPEPEATPAVLDILARRSLRGTFFVIGEKLATAQGCKLAQRAHAEGHWIGNHSWSHSLPLGLRVEANVVEMEIGRTQDAIGALSHPQRLFRPFGGGGNLDRRLLSRPAVDYLVRGKFTCVLWNAIPRDWNDPDGWVERALQQCKKQLWTLMVLHDIPNAAGPQLDLFLDRVADAGGRMQQEFPPECMPVVEGKVVRPIEDYVMRPART